MTSAASTRPSQARAEQRGKPGRHDDDRPAGQRRDDPDRRRRDPEKIRCPGQEWRERRLVDVAEGEVVRGYEEVQLVLLEAVAPAHRELDRHEHGGDHPGEPGNPVGAGIGRLRHRGVGRDERLDVGSDGTVGLVHDVTSRCGPAGAEPWAPNKLISE